MRVHAPSEAKRRFLPHPRERLRRADGAQPGLTIIAPVEPVIPRTRKLKV